MADDNLELYFHQNHDGSSSLQVHENRLEPGTGVLNNSNVNNTTTKMTPSRVIGLKRSLSDFQSNGSRPPLPPSKGSITSSHYPNKNGLGRAASNGEIVANKINKFEQLAKQGSPPKEEFQKGLWFYKDGLRSPTTPPPRSRSNSLSPSPVMGHSTTSLPICVQVSHKETPSPQPPASFVHNGPIGEFVYILCSCLFTMYPFLIIIDFSEPKVITAALASSPKLFQKSEKTVTIPAAFVLTPKSTPKSSPAPTPPRTPSPSPSNGPSRPPRKKTPPIPPPRTNSSLLKKGEIISVNSNKVNVTGNTLGLN